MSLKEFNEHIIPTENYARLTGVYSNEALELIRSAKKKINSGGNLIKEGEADLIKARTQLLGDAKTDKLSPHKEGQEKIKRYSSHYALSSTVNLDRALKEIKDITSLIP